MAMSDNLRQVALVDSMACLIKQNPAIPVSVEVPDQVIQRALLELYRTRHPGLVEPEIFIREHHD